MEPIPLRSLTVLLNYERVISDPRFQDVRLMQSSITDLAMVDRLKANYAFIFKDVPKTIEKTNFNIFRHYAEPAISDPPSTICSIHPEAGLEVQALTHAQRELMYYETRGHDGCYKAIGLYQFFFDLCPPEQKISIQIADEEPIIVGLEALQIIKFKINGPKLNSISSIPSKPLVLHTGQKEDECHAVSIFVHGDNPNKFIIVDMSSMQYGEAGRGMHGENYFLGTLSDYLVSMKKVCKEATVTSMLASRLGSSGNENEKRLRACAKKVWERWQNREKEGWCNFCGKPGSNFMRCGACRMKKVSYCCKEHQKSDWKLHQHTCEKNKK